MKAFYLFLHGDMTRCKSIVNRDVNIVDVSGFYATRSVLSKNKKSAEQKVILKIKRDIILRFPDIEIDCVDIIIEELEETNFINIFVKSNRGFTFYK